MKLVILTLVRDEGSRWLPSLLSQWQQYGDEIIALDDNSNDDTVDILHAAGAEVVAATGPTAWGAESSARQRLFTLGVESDADWLLWLDGDMGFTRSPRAVCEAADAAGADAVSFRLYDLWQADGRDLRYREDGWWLAHKVPRVWAVRRDFAAGAGAAGIAARGLHCGHLPPLPYERVVIAPQDVSLLHYAYSREDERIKKHIAYMSKVNELTLQEQQHAITIVDPTPRTLPLELHCEYEVRYGR